MLTIFSYLVLTNNIQVIYRLRHYLIENFFKPQYSVLILIYSFD